ncbi:hypothetical protein AMTRI_Chr03g53620 [Amborella trichopoda]|uniref:FAD synthetase, chloroplastic n=1 Tax=Amborella trichopoda TaxID=13333 RepID=UPI0009BEE830|nr:FAD synthetase, chloroplastic [Amborella trichopoda]|eukprot:XP_020519775.1 FAD synthetase, chloroplastic [Amborella trichopoda]
MASSCKFFSRATTFSSSSFKSSAKSKPKPLSPSILDSSSPLRVSLSSRLPSTSSCGHFSISRAAFCSKQKRYLIVQKSLNSSCASTGIHNSREPQEVSLTIKGERDDKFLIDCGPDNECVLGGIVALGKFDALHIGHRELAIQASKAGFPFLLSFVGMAEVLGWEQRAPIVPKCDRNRVLSLWVPLCGNMIPLECRVEFSTVRHLTPRQFVERLSKELGVSGVVAGENYRFGYKAAGDASDLVRLCKEYGMDAYIVKSVMDKSDCSNGGGIGHNSRERGQVSSTRVRYCLAAGDIQHVSELLGRKHRLILAIPPGCVSKGNRISVSKSCMLNQPPKDGLYTQCAIFVNEYVGYGDAIIDSMHIHLTLHDVGSTVYSTFQGGQLVGVEFGSSGKDVD